jgi:hypothetical protein
MDQPSTLQKHAALLNKDIHWQNYFAVFGVKIDYEHEESWQVQLCAIDIESFPLGKQVLNHPKYDWKVARSVSQSEERWVCLGEGLDQLLRTIILYCMI